MFILHDQLNHQDMRSIFYMFINTSNMRDEQNTKLNNLSDKGIWEEQL